MRVNRNEVEMMVARTARTVKSVRRLFGRFRFAFVPTVEQCLGMIGELEAKYGGERAAAEVIGPSIITVRAWKRRGTMSMPSRRLVWLIWALSLHPERTKSVEDLITWGRLR